VHDVAIEQSKEEGLTMNILAKTYRYLDEEEGGAQ
jgi:Tfp pilus assembly protein PilO